MSGSALSEQQIRLLETSFAAVAPRGEELVELFYKNLFADYPQVIPMFANTIPAEQQKKLLASLKLVVGNLRKPEVLGPALEKMGARHVEYGTEESHYPAVGATLLKSLATITGELWNDELQGAWATAYGAISEKMLQGASKLAAV